MRLEYCYDEKDQKGNFIALWVSADGVHYETDTVTYDFSKLKVEKKLRDAATLTLDATVTNEAGESRIHQKTVKLVRELGEWRLDSNTAVAYYAISHLRDCSEIHLWWMKSASRMQ